MTVRASLAFGSVLGCLIWHSAAHAQDLFSTRLDTVPIDFRSQSATTGNGSVLATLDDGELTIDGTFAGLASAATEAWVHVGAAVGARGPAAHELAVSRASAGSVHGSIRLSRREIAALGAGHLYIQIHSQSAPEGNLWGWLLPEEQGQ